jgi:2,5-furandicarboxylate decarboxylase 1
MEETFRGFLDQLREAGELVDFRQPIDIRHIATLVDQSDKALFFHKVIGYDMPVVSGIIRTRERAMMSMGATEFRQIEDRLKKGIDNPIPPERVASSPTREIVMKGDDVDLYKLPIPMSSIYDGGPMITAGVVMARDAEFCINTGVYRDAQQHAGVRSARLRGEQAVADFDQHRNPSHRTARRRLQGAARHR